jgi:choline dehydrogenase
MKKKYDYVIVGAGAGGCVMAGRLSEDPAASVLVLEAGPSDISIFVQMPGAQAYPLMDEKRTWNFETGPEPHLGGRSIKHLRGRMLGGSSSINGMVYVRGNPRDYDTWAAEGLKNWSYAHCLPYFRKLETYDKGASEYRGGDGPISITTNKAELPMFQAFLEAGRQAGHIFNDDYNGYRQEGIHVHQANIDNGIRDSAARAYLHPAMRKGRVDVTVHALVTKIRFDGKRAIGVEYQHRGETVLVEAKREVILCGGAYNSPHLLLLSGVGDPKHLSTHDILCVQDLPGVGRSLEDHICAPVAYRASRSGVSPGVNMNAVKMAWTGAQWLFFRTGLGATNLWETGCFFRSHDGVDYCNIQHEFVPLLGEYGQGKLVADEGFYYSTCLMRPKSRGFVELRSADPKSLPRIVNNYLEHPDDRTAMIGALKHTDEICQQPAWDALRGEGVSPLLRKMSDSEIMAYLEAKVLTQYHPASTCRMGYDSMSVTDEEGRVHGLEALRIADSSVMRHVTSGNLHCPVLMLAEKVADQILGRSLDPSPVRYADMIGG